jgi:hypothetical protein
MNLTDILALVFSTTAIIAVFGGMYTFTKFAQIRDSKYLIEENRVQLDKTREVFENEISRLHDQIYKDDGRFKELNHLLMDVVEKQGATLPAKGGNAAAYSFLSQMGISDELEVKEKTVFVLTPFSKAEQATYNVIAQTCQNLGLQVRRGDEKRVVGPLLPYILKEIAQAWLIIANLNGRNPNVFYELGIAQALSKPCLLVGKSEENLPFDLSHQQVILYNDKDALRLGLTEALSRVALSEGMQSPMRTYAKQAVTQSMIIDIMDPRHIDNAINVLRSHEDISTVTLLGNSNSLFVEGTSNSRQFISDVSETLRDQEIPVGSSRLVSAPGLE